MNLVHEYNKVVNAYNAQTISEGKMRYELFKLECVARILNKDWQPPTRSGLKTADYRIIKEDYIELVNLRKSGILNEERFNRDCIKIDAICEAIGVPYPGTENPSINIIVESMDEYDDMDDGDEYAGMDEDNEFEETSGPQLDGILRFDDGTSISRWIINSEFEWQCDETSTVNYHGSLEGVEKIIYKNIDKLGGLQTIINNLDDEIHKQEDINQGASQYLMIYIKDLYKLKELLISNQYMKYLNSGRTLHASLFELTQNTIDMLMTQ